MPRNQEPWLPLKSLASTGQSRHSCAVTVAEHVQAQVGASLCDVLQSHGGNECITGEEAVKSLLEADDCKSHICLRTNVKFLKREKLMPVTQSIQGHLGGKTDHCKCFRRG